MRAQFLVPAVVIFALTGCATVENHSPILPSTAQPEAGYGYITGLFAQSSGSAHALVLKAVGSNLEYILPLGDDLNEYNEPRFSYKTITIKVLPGTYSISEWFTYATIAKSLSSKRYKVESNIANKVFAVTAGTIVHLGDFEISLSRNGRTTTQKISFFPAAQREMKSSFNRAYPNLAEQPLYCLLCKDTSLDSQGLIWYK